MIAGLHDIHGNWDDKELSTQIRSHRDGVIRVYTEDADDEKALPTETSLYVMFNSQQLD